MKIAIDIDDVTADMVTALTKYNNEVYGTKLTLADHNDYDLAKVWQCPADIAVERVYTFYRSERMNDLQPIEGAIEGINKLSEKYTIQFITSRPSFLQEKSMKWLAKYFPGKNLPIIFTNQYSKGENTKTKKSTVCKELNIRYIIEDAPPYALDCAQNEITVLLFKRPWNVSLTDDKHIIKVSNWSEIVQNLQNV